MASSNVFDFSAFLARAQAERRLKDLVEAILADDAVDLFEAHQLWEDGDFLRAFG